MSRKDTKEFFESILPKQRKFILRLAGINRQVTMFENLTDSQKNKVEQTLKEHNLI